MPEARVIPISPDVRVDDELAARRGTSAPAGRVAPTEPSDWERKVAGGLAFLRRRITGDYPVDDFGFDPDLTDHVLLAAARPLYSRYFRVETRGLENVPDEGGALVVANHSGTVPPGFMRLRRDCHAAMVAAYPHLKLKEACYCIYVDS